MKRNLAALLLTLWCAPLFTFAADWQPCYGGLLRCNDDGIIWNVETPEGSVNAAQLGSNDDLVDFFTMLGTFLNDVIVPLLFGLALLFFLFNVARYFIIESTNTDKREEARRAALYGILAFVFLVSLWGIVNVLVNGLGFDREESICPDYLNGWCGNLSRDNFDSAASFGNPSGIPAIGSGGGGSGSGGSGSGGSGGGAVLPGGGSGGTQAPTSQLVALLYGTLRDTASFNFVSGAPRSGSSVVAIPANASCSAGLGALQTAAQFEDTQASYLMYQDAGAVRFQNLTDQTSQTNISIDADTLSSITGTNPVIVHTHPSKTVDDLNLPMRGQGPSAADMELLCASAAAGATIMVVDEANVWSLTKTPGSCPRTQRERDDLIVIDALLQLSVMGTADRAREFTALLEDPAVPDALQNRLEANYGNLDVASLGSSEVFALADTLARNGGMQIRQQSISSFCGAY